MYAERNNVDGVYIPFQHLNSVFPRHLLRMPGDAVCPWNKTAQQVWGFSY